MKKGLLFAGLLFVLTLPATAAESLSQCLTNCPSGVNNCSNCCLNQFNAAVAPCDNACTTVQTSCLNAAAQKCGGNSNACYFQAADACYSNWIRCRQACNPPIAGGCPGEVPPQNCPYDCQMWNPASKTCVGAAMNGCKAYAAMKAKAAATTKQKAQPAPKTGTK